MPKADLPVSVQLFFQRNLHPSSSSNNIHTKLKVILDILKYLLSFGALFCGESGGWTELCGETGSRTMPANPEIHKSAKKKV
jgi:hypothetical protein